MVPVFWSGFSAPIRVSCALVRQFVYRLMTIRRSISAYSHDMAVYDIQAILSLNGKYIEEIAIACCEGKITGHNGLLKEMRQYREQICLLCTAALRMFSIGNCCVRIEKRLLISKKSPSIHFQRPNLSFCCLANYFICQFLCCIHTVCILNKNRYGIVEFNVPHDTL